MDYKYILKIIIIAFFSLSLIAFINSIGFNLDYEHPPIKLLTMEGLANPPDTSIIINKSDAFCESHRGSSGTLDKSCGKLTKNNCNSTSCCVWTSDSKCLAGGAKGPTFNTDSNGKTKQLDYYYFQNKCHGAKCP